MHSNFQIKICSIIFGSSNFTTFSFHLHIVYIMLEMRRVIIAWCCYNWCLTVEWSTVKHNWNNPLRERMNQKKKPTKKKTIQSVSLCCVLCTQWVHEVSIVFVISVKYYSVDIILALLVLTITCVSLTRITFFFFKTVLPIHNGI